MNRTAPEARQASCKSVADDCNRLASTDAAVTVLDATRVSVLMEVAAVRAVQDRVAIVPPVLSMLSA